jgi:uncharacterized protein (DUF362 family)
MGYFHCSHGVTRRTFLASGGSALLLGGLSGCGSRAQGSKEIPAPPSYTPKQFTGKCVPVEKPEFALPGRYPGRVIEVHDPHSVVDGAIKLEPVRAMLSRAMMELTGAPNAVEAWRSFFTKGDRVGIKVNPVGQKTRPDAVGVISNFATIMAVVDGLRTAGIEHKDIVLFERYAAEFRSAGYETFVERELPGMRWYASGIGYSPTQTELDGHTRDEHGEVPERDPHVLGYDPDVFQKLDFDSPRHDKKDERRFQSHLGKIVTGDLVNKIITLPLLKDHRSGGITIALKNLSHGFVNNVARSHNGDGGPNDNRCGDFIPAMVALKPTRQKSVLHVMDALVSVFEGGPGLWNDTWGTWERKSLFVATDPVAMDHVGWDLLDAERAKRWWAPVAKMGKKGVNRFGSEQFNIRQPEHVEIASTKYNLGIFDPAKIEYRRVELI